MAQEDDLRALGKIMDFLRAVSIILAIMNVYWYCYEAMHIWGVTIGVVDRILINFNRTGGLFHSILYTKLFSLLLLALSCLGTKGVKAEKMSWNKIWTVLVVGSCLFFLNWWILLLPISHLGNATTSSTSTSMRSANSPIDSEVCSAAMSLAAVASLS